MDEMTLENLEAALLEAGFIRIKDLNYDLIEDSVYKGGYLLDSLCYDYGDGTVLVFRDWHERSVILQECEVNELKKKLRCKVAKNGTPILKHFSSPEQTYNYIFED